MMSARSGARAACAAIVAIAMAAGGPLASAVGEPPDEAAAYAASQAAVGRTLGDYQFIDQNGQPLRLSSLRGRPVVLNIVYTSCYHVCSGLTARVRDAARVARDALGPASFALLTVGFDTANDTPERMLSYARDRGAVQPGWHFVSADAVTAARFTRDVGFTYVASPKGFDHITQTTLINGAGRVVLQIYGDNFATPQLVEPLKKLVWGGDASALSFDGLVRTVRLFCTIYDPASGRYRFDYSLITEIVAGVLAFGMAAAAIVSAARRAH
jgi:protein SCO1/2